MCNLRPPTATTANRLLAAASALLLAGLACAPTLPGPDPAATVHAVSTSVQATLSAGQAPATAPAASQPPSPAPTAEVGPTPVPPPASPTAAPAAPTAAPSSTAISRPNGPLVRAARLTGPITLDGDLGDWPPLAERADALVYRPENWTGPGDLGVGYALAWDSAGLYLAALVVDDVHVQTQSGANIFLGDSLEILMDADLAGDFGVARLNGDDYQIGLSPGGLAGDAPQSYIWYPQALAGPPAGVVVAARAAGSGYTLEAAIPWTLLAVTPAANSRFGFVLSASDNDSPAGAEQQSLAASAATRRLTNPTTWGTLELGP